MHIYQNVIFTRPDQFSLWQRWFPQHLGYPMPLTMLSYQWDQWLWLGRSAGNFALKDGWGFHVSNLIYFTIIVALLYRLCRLLVASRWAAFGGVAFFAFHPVVAESVSWVTGRKDLLMTLFSLAAILAFLRLLKEPHWKRGLLFVLFGILALGGKPGAVFLLPFTLCFLVFFQAHSAPPKEEPSVEHSVVEGSSTLSEKDGKVGYIPSKKTWWLALGAIGILTCAGLVSFMLSFSWQQQVGGAQLKFSILGLLRRAVWALGFHCRLILYPVGLRPKYIYEPGGFDGMDLLALVVLGSFLWILARKELRRTALGFGVMLFVFAYLPVSNLIPLQRFLADTYVFLPMTGLAVCVAFILERLYLSSKDTVWRSLRIVLVCLLLCGMTLSWFQARIWRGSPSLWAHTIQFHFHPRVCRSLGHAYIQAIQYDKAILTYKLCMKHFGMGLYTNNLGLAYFLKRDYQKAYEIFLRIQKDNPRDTRAAKYLYFLKKMGFPRIRPQKRHSPFGR